jgi:hypothetical protein
MDDDHLNSYLRWRAADESGADEAADAAFRAVFQSAVAEPVVSSDFTARTMSAVAAAAQRDARRVRRMRAGLVGASIVGGAAGAYYGAGLAVSALSGAFTRLLNLFVAAVVGAAAALQAGADFWTLLANVGRGAAAVAADPEVTFVILIIQGLAIVALLALQRLLGSDGESFE